MFKHILTSSALIATLAVQPALAKVVDLGTHANTYKIEEKSFKVSIKEGIAELNTTQMQNDIQESFMALAEGRSTIPVSMEEEHYTVSNIYTVPFDVTGIDGSIAYHAGEQIVSSMPAGQEINLCFIDASNLEVVPLITEEFGKCIYFTANNDIGNVFPLIKPYSSDGRIYPMSERYTRRFLIKKFPTKIRLFDDKIEYRILNHKKLVEEAARRKL